MFRILFILFISVPIVEIFLLIQVGDRIGAGWTIFLVILTAVIGASLLRLQGLATMRRLNECASRGEPPAIPMIEGGFLLVAGALLLTPGFFTDVVGFLFLVPPIRQQLAMAILKKGVWAMAGQAGFRETRTDAKGHKTLEGEYERKDD
ncbi:MAG: FxsA family protein [Gammaproteobacteria bacterium]|nr:FxsA family protein [Gammaproteobacteria bacterium]MDH5778178.1 FxsA family protein [Gammaproteobacteria bacterium]